MIYKIIMGLLFTKPDEKAHEIIKLNVELDPTIWGNLPKFLYDYIAVLADIDTRRAMGFKPRKLHIDKTQTLICRLPNNIEYTSFKYFPDRNTIIRFNIYHPCSAHMKVWNNVRYDSVGLYKPVIGDFIEELTYITKKFERFPIMNLPITKPDKNNIEVIKHIEELADIDTRRAMGLKPRKLHIDKTQTLICRLSNDIGYSSFKYFPDRNTIIRFHIYSYCNVHMTVWSNVKYDSEGLYTPVIGDFIEVRTYNTIRFQQFTTNENSAYYINLPVTITNT